MKIEALPILPWLDKLLAELSRQYLQQKLPHAILFTGVDGVGKEHLSLSLANNLLCFNKEQDVPCRHCKSCHLFRSNNHPDLFRLEKLEKKKSLGIEQVREMISGLLLSATLGSARVVLIANAENLTESAANALLKTLEEPNGDTYFLLTTSNPEHLLATIRSRCRTIAIPNPDSDTVLNWLSEKLPEQDNIKLKLAYECASSPLKAFSLIDSDGIDNYQEFTDNLLNIRKKEGEVYDISARWQKKGVELLPLHWWFSLHQELLRSKISNKSDGRLNESIKPFLPYFADSSLFQMQQFMDSLINVMREWQEPYNHQLMLEGLLHRWQNL